MHKPMREFVLSFSALLLGATLAAGCKSDAGNASGGASAGSATVFLLNTVEWGRLVNVVDLNDVAIKSNVVIEPAIQSDATYELTTNALTDQATLKIKFAQGTSPFATAYAALDDDLPELETKSPIGFGGAPSLPPFPAIPRNAALKLTFNNEIDSSTLTASTVQMLQGSPALTPFSIRRLIDSANGKILVLDPTTSQYEADQEGGQANSVGFPQGVSNLFYNLKLAIPGEGSTTFSFGVLKDNFGHALSAATTDPVEAGSIVRVFRSAMTGDSEPEFLADSSAPKVVAFQKVNIASIQTVGSKKRITYSFRITSASGTVDTLDEGICWLKPGVGDVFFQGNAFGVVLSSGDENPGSVNPASPNTSSNFVVDLTVLSTSAFATGTATTQHLYVDANDGARKLCFLDFTTDPSFVAIANDGVVNGGSDSENALGVLSTAAIALHFSKPMNPATILANDDIILGNRNISNPANLPNISGVDYYGLNTGPGNLSSLVPFQVQPSFDQKTFTVTSANPLRNDGVSSDCASVPSGSSGLSINCFYLHLALGGIGPRDLGGNPLPTVSSGGSFFSVSRIFPATGTTDSGGIALRFNTSNLVEDGATSNSIVGGQYSAGSTLGQISARPVQHFSRVCDQGVVPNANAIVEFMVGAGTNGTSPNGGPVTPTTPPLSPHGARLQQVYRYFDLGFTIGDTNFDRRVDDYSFFNLDVEGLNWAADTGIIASDRFSNISISLGHSQFAPDEYVNNNPACTPPALLCYRDSGLGGSAPAPLFADSYFENANSTALEISTDFGPKNVFIGTYLINPLNQFQYPASGSATTILMPWPDFQQTFTWRDTRLVNRNNGLMVYGGPTANGIDPDVFCNAGLYTDSALNLAGNCLVCDMTPAPLCQQTADAGWANTSGVAPDDFWQGSKIKDFVPTNYPQTGNPNLPTVPTVGLPLLVDFKVQPDYLALGNNRFRAFQANSGAVTNTLFGNPFYLYPRFRLLSAGGVYQNTNVLDVFPDSENSPKGEVLSTAFAGFSDAGDDVVYAGQVDFVTKTSVVYTRWFATGASSPTYTDVILEPTAQELAPLGLEVEVAFRGGTGTLLSSSADANGLNMDPYGNFPVTGAAVTPTTGWSTDITDIDGKPNFQVRITFKGNATANLAPWLSGLQVAWTE